MEAQGNEVRLKMTGCHVCGSEDVYGSGRELVKNWRARKVVRLFTALHGLMVPLS